ncbi:MAG: hypothetical protein GY787_16120 [Alteromonadales bacterium]|nr:hypothetical protein [Alteromonadales bacterium]
MLNLQIANKILGGELLDMPKLSVVDGYAQDFKRKVLNYVYEWDSSRRAGVKFGIQRTTIDRWVRDDNRY